MLRIRTGLAVFRSTPLRAGASLKRCPQISSPHLRLKSTLPPRSVPSPNVSKTPSPFSPWRPGPARLVRSVRHASGKAIAQESGNQAPRSLSQTFKDLSRRYGWAAVGVYAALSVLDFPFCFLAVRLIGPDRIAEAEHAVVDGFWNLVGVVIPSMQAEDRAQKEAIADAEARETQPVAVHAHNASIWTQLLLAYGVHKSLIFFRVPLTAAVTPKIVKTLRSWGWNIGKAPKAVKSPPSRP